MELSELRDELAEIRPDEEDAEDSLHIIMAKVGQMAEAFFEFDDDGLDEESVAAHRRDLLAGLIISAVEYAEEHDLSVENAVDERLERMRERKEQREEIMDAIDEGDAEALADALGAQAQEVPTGMFEEDGDGDGTEDRSFH